MSEMASRSQLAALLDLGTKYDGWVAYLRSVRPRYIGTPMLAKIDAALADGEKKRSSIGAVVQTVRDAWQWLEGATGDAWGALKSGLGFSGLGILPALPAVWVYGLGAAAVGSAIIVMTNWINSASTLRRELDSFDASVKRQIDAGVPADQAVREAGAAVTGIVSGETGRVTGEGASGFGAGIAAQIGSVAKWAMLAGGAYLIARKMGWLK